jgi:ubiquinone/menaquinone biosynthesis C-methylase UbiE
MTEQNHPREWDDVDAGEEPAEFAAFLEAVSGAEAVRAYKRRSHRLLDPSPGDRILDVGCGTGEDALMLARTVGPEGDVVGVDESEAMVATARDAADGVPGVRFAEADVCDLPFADDRFDAARADRVFQHLADPAAALAEMRRVTRPGGRVGLSEPDWGTAIIEAPGGYSEEFLSMAHSNIANPAIGRRLYGLSREVGLTDVDVDTWTPTSTDLDFLVQVGELDAWTEAMVAAGAVTAADVEEWFEGLRRADDRDALIGSVTGFTVVGTVPDPEA